MWQRFHDWRRSRPFWGGLLTLLAGLEIFGSMNLEINGGTITIGQEGFSSYLVVIVLLLCGVLAWFTPQQRHFYGLLAAFVAIYSLIGVNLGGFFAGMLLGIAGGGLVFAWNPEIASAAAEEEGEEEGEGPKASSPRHATMMIMVVALSVSMLAVMTAQTRAESAGPCGQPDPTPSASPSPPAAAPDGSGPGGVLGPIVDFLGRLLGAGPSQAGSSKAQPAPGTPPTPVPCPTSPSQPGQPGGPGKPTTPGGPGTAKPTKSPTPKPKVIAAAADQVPVAKRPSKMTGSRVSMTNLVFDGIIDLPTADGSVRALKFTMTSSDTDDFLLHVYHTGGGSVDTDLRSSKLTVRGGGVQFFTTRFRGSLFGLIPVDYTPESPPPPIPLPFVFFTDADIALVWVDSPTLDAPDLRITLARPA